MAEDNRFSPSNNYHLVVKELLEKGKSESMIQQYILSRGFSESDFQEMLTKAHTMMGVTYEQKVQPSNEMTQESEVTPLVESQDVLDAPKENVEKNVSHQGDIDPDFRKNNSNFSISWKLFKTCFKILRTNKSLMLLPILSGLSAVLLGVVFVTGGLFLQTGGVSLELAEKSLDNLDIVGQLFLLSYYILSVFLVIFFNVALASNVKRYFEGKSVSLGLGLRDSMSHIGNIFVYSLVIGTVGFILKKIEERVGLFGKIMVWIFGAGIGLATFFIVPVLATENISFWQAIKKSTRTFKDTWGKLIVGGFGMGVIHLLSVLLILITGAAIILFIHNGIGFFIGTMFIIFAFIFSVILFMTLDHIYTMVLYLYANNKTVPVGVDVNLLEHAFKK